MKKTASLMLLAACIIGPSVAIAQSIPDGPVASPPGWSCYASGGVVTCIKLKQQGSKSEIGAQGHILCAPFTKMKRMHRLKLAIACCILAGCATHPSRDQTVETGMILPAGAQQSRLKEERKFLMAVPIDDPTPAFPDEVTSDVDATLCVELVVHEDGSVGDVKQIDTAPSCEPLESEASQQFLPPS
jgi:hypothetical protein